MIEDFTNISNETFTELPERVIGCNIYHCEFDNCENTTFERCNIEFSTFKKKTSFERTNVIVCEVIEGSVFSMSNNISQEEYDEMNKLLEVQ